MSVFFHSPARGLCLAAVFCLSAISPRTGQAALAEPKASATCWDFDDTNSLLVARTGEKIVWPQGVSPSVVTDSFAVFQASPGDGAIMVRPGTRLVLPVPLKPGSIVTFRFFLPAMDKGPWGLFTSVFPANVPAIPKVACRPASGDGLTAEYDGATITLDYWHTLALMIGKKTTDGAGSQNADVLLDGVKISEALIDPSGATIGDVGGAGTFYVGSVAVYSGLDAEEAGFVTKGIGLPVGVWRFPEGNPFRAERGANLSVATNKGHEKDQACSALPGGGCRVGRWTSLALRHGLVPTNTTPYTLAFDCRLPAASNGKWRCLYDLTMATNREGSVFINGKNQIGASGHYLDAGLAPDTWHRIVVAYAGGGVHYTVDGKFIGSCGGFLERGGLCGPALYLFGDDNGEDYEIDVRNVMLFDRRLDDGEAAALGGPATK